MRITCSRTLLGRVAITLSPPIGNCFLFFCNLRNDTVSHFYNEILSNFCTQPKRAVFSSHSVALCADCT
uniref:Putative secreted protein n=1 Tax=Lutzomyia longipalpis TaxID=7200 RepID=A0A7G3AM95_LUTLO